VTDQPAATTPALTGHGRIVCSCGAVIAQCRCNQWRPHKHTEVRVVQDGCEACRAKQEGG